MVRPTSAAAASPESFAQVGEWLKPTDCKSVPPSEVRRFESFPVHHLLSRLAGVSRSESEAGVRWRNPEPAFYEKPAKDLSLNEPPVQSAGLLRRAGRAGVDYASRPEVEGGHTGDSGFVRGEVGLAAERSAAPGQRR